MILLFVVRVIIISWYQRKRTRSRKERVFLEMREDETETRREIFFARKDRENDKKKKIRDVKNANTGLDLMR